MTQVTITLTDEQVEYIRLFRGPDVCRPVTVYGQIGDLIYDALPPLHPFKDNDVVYFDGRSTHPRIVQSAHHIHGVPLVTVIDGQGKVHQGMLARNYTKETRNVR